MNVDKPEKRPADKQDARPAKKKLKVEEIPVPAGSKHEPVPHGDVLPQAASCEGVRNPVDECG